MGAAALELAAGARLALRMDGTLAKGGARLEGRAGEPVAMAFDWQDAARLDTLAWTFALDATQLEIASLGLPEQAPIDATLRAHSVAAAPADEPMATPGRVWI